MRWEERARGLWTLVGDGFMGVVVWRDRDDADFFDRNWMWELRVERTDSKGQMYHTQVGSGRVADVEAGWLAVQDELKIHCRKVGCSVPNILQRKL